jgi:hypothetical protein
MAGEPYRGVHSLAVDPFAIIMLGGVGGLVIALVLIARAYPGSGADLIDWKPTRSAELEAQNEIDDLDQLLEAANRRRRRLGEPELTEEAMHATVAEEQRETERRRERYRADRDAQDMLDTVNARRRAKGLPEYTLDDFRRDADADPS